MVCVPVAARTTMLRSSRADAADGAIQGACFLRLELGFVERHTYYSGREFLRVALSHKIAKSAAGQSVTAFLAPRRNDAIAIGANYA